MPIPPEATAPQRLAAGALFTAAFTTFGMTVLFGVETAFLAGLFDWSLAGLLHLPPVVYVPLGAIPLGSAIVATVWIARRTWAYERNANA